MRLMNQSQQIIPNLRQLAGLERVLQGLKKNDASRKSAEAEIESLRAFLPTSILIHYDARRARGKTAVAPVTNGVCGSCHLSVPHGQLAVLRRDGDGLNICEHCGAFIYLAKEGLPEAEVPLRASVSEPKKTTRTKRPAHLVKASRRKAVATH